MIKIPKSKIEKKVPAGVPSSVSEEAFEIPLNALSGNSNNQFANFCGHGNFFNEILLLVGMPVVM